jgi:small basic protein (TIGR04137 family)
LGWVIEARAADCLGELSIMTMDKSLRIRAGLARSRSVLSRGERIAQLQQGDRWVEGRSPLGLPKVRVMKLAMKKKKKKKEEEGAEGAAAPAADTKAGAKPAAKAAPKK